MLLFTLGVAGSGFAAGPSVPALPTTGVNLPRDSGGWLNVAVRSHRMVIAFFDGQKVPVAPDRRHGLVQYQQVTRGIHRTSLRFSRDGRRLVSPTRIDPPDEFLVNLALFNDGADEGTETHEFFYHAP
ncbi:MAG: hypothetical protein JWQ83_2006 [Lacunisphaera sp.]|nr:hypothetical protein [Lacunisphaera sp.]